jgi:hypothetical protein
MPISYLLDTNVYCQFFIPFSQRSPNFSKVEVCLANPANAIKEFYIAEITSMEIYSAVGKYARGKNAHTSNCNRKILDNQNQEQNCNNIWISPAVNGFNKREIKILSLQIDNAENQRGDIHAHILPITPETIHEGKRLLRQYAHKLALGSHDAFIAGFLIAANKQGQNLSLITFDKALKNVLKSENQPFLEF